jgi:REP element-mobilizing transposase RayT
VEYPGAIYHVLNRGDRREPIFRDDRDRRQFLGTFAEACAKTSWQVHALCLMPNHFHLVLETPQPNLVAGMKWFLGTYTGRFNRRHRLSGHLFGGRYKALIVDGSGEGYLGTVCEYMHLNPARARLVRPEQPLSAYPWSSYPEYLKAPRRRWAWLRVDRVLGEMGIQRDDAPGRREFARTLEQRRREEEPAEWRTLRRGWFLGKPHLKERLLEVMAGRVGRHHSGEEVRETAVQKAERLVKEELRRRGWTEGELARRRKTDPQKVAIARRLRRETVMTVEWVAQRLRMGSRHTAANCLRGGPIIQ